MQAMSNPYQGYTGTSVPIRQRTAPSAPRLSKNTGVYAGVFALGLGIFAAAGVIWGLLRPTYTAYVEDAETASVAAAINVEFRAFIWFAVATGILGAALALGVFLRSESTRGLGMLLWVGVVAVVGAGAFIIFGNFSAALLHAPPGDYADLVGETFQVVPNMTPGSALFTAPFLAVLMYWCATFVTPAED